MNKNTLQKLFLCCFTLCSLSSLFAQPVIFTGSLPEVNVTTTCDAIPPAAMLTAEGCLAPASFVYLNEIHYDNDGGDVGEFIEVVGTAGFDLSNCAIELYNGSNGALYNTLPLTGTIDDEGTGFGAVSFSYPANGIQNGGPDGFALVCGGEVVQFLSYEGSFTASGGTADGMTSTDIGVSEPGTTPIGQSLRLVNVLVDNPGCLITDFVWSGPSAESPGTLNPGQSFDINDCEGSTAATVVLAETTTPGACPGAFTLTRVWTATDACGTTAQYTQTITAEDNSAPTFINPPANITVDCGTPVPDAEVVFASDNCNTGAATAAIWINEIHYDNTGGDVGEFIEIAGTAGFDYTGYSLVLYNGNGGAPYGTTTIMGIIGNEGNGFGAASFSYPVNGIQNGAPDGVALVDALGNTVQFLSYEGTFTAVGGPADGMTSTDIGVLEPGAIGQSLQLEGTGIGYDDFTWTGPTTESPGTLNDNQVFATIVATMVETPAEGICGSILRTYTADDGCGNIATYVQTITVADGAAPVITCPPSQTLTCFQTIPAPATSAADFIALGGTISDNCTANLADFTIFAQNADNGGDNCPGNGREVVRTYSIIDACGNVASCTQTFTYLESTQAPVITSVLPSCFKFCASLANPMESDITFNTDCSFDGTVNISGPIQIGADNCPGTIYRYTYTVSDDCGRTSAPVTRDFIIGNDAPTISAPFNLILECGDPNNQDYIDEHLQLVDVNTSCELGFTVNYFPQNFNLNACNGTTIVTFVATDDCGRTASATTTISIQDVTPPSFTFEPVLSCDEIECGADAQFFFDKWISANIDSLQAEDACDTDVSITAVNPQLNTTCTADGKAVSVVTFRATDNCNNSTTITRTFTIENTAPALLTNIPADATMECDGSTPTFGADPTVNENCQTTLVSMDVVDDSNPCAVTYTRTWIATDACGGLTTSASQTITVVDTEAPVAPAAPADVNIQCAADLPAPVDLTAIDACEGDITVSPSAVITPGNCENQFTMVRTWTFVDNCGNQSSVSQTLNVNDTTAPTPPAAPADVTIQCAADLPPPVDLTATDNCGEDITVSPSAVITPGNCENEFTMVRTWTFIDECGNASNVSQTLIVNDNTAPTFTAVPADATIDCADSPVFGTVTATDNCGTVNVTSEDSVDGNVMGMLSGDQEVPPSGSAGTGMVTGGFNPLDGSLNISVNFSGLSGNTVASHIHLGAAGSNGGVLYGLPIPTGVTSGSFTASLTLSASEALELAAGNLYVNVHTEAVPSGEIRAQLSIKTCDATYTRIWTATDECGNTATASQTLTTSDTEAPTFTSVPADYDSPCIDEDGNITVYAQVCASSDDAEEDEANGDEGSMNLTSSDLEMALDNSQNKNVKVGVRFKDLNIPAGATITSAYIQFTADATIDIDPSELTIHGEDSDNASTFTLEDFNISSRPQTDASTTWQPGDWLEIGDNLEVQRTPDLTAIVQEIVDRTGFTTESALAFIIEGFGKRTAIAYDLNPAQAPELYVTYEAGDIFGTPTTADNCNEVTLTFEDTTEGDCAGSMTRTWTATDACGNSSTASQTVNFSDNVPPVFTFVPASVLSDCDFQDFPPTFGTPEVMDNCGGMVTITFEDYFYEGDEDSCEDETDYEYRREWTATDACGNTTTAVQNYDVNGNDYSSMTGFIYTEEEAPVEDVQVSLEGFGGFNALSISGGNGTYGYNTLTAGSNYTVKPTLDENYLNGVSTYDLVLISKHILQTETLDSPYKLIAADVNNSGSITTLDLVELRKNILFVEQGFTNNTSWRFVEASYSFPQPNNPFAAVFPEETFINGLVLGEEYNYVGVKIGDVNNSAVANSFMAVEDRTTTDDLNFVTADATLKANETYEMIVRAENFNNVSGYQFTLNFDATQLEFVGVTPAELSNLNESNFGFAKANEGAIMTSWNSDKGVNLTADATLFRLTFKAKSEVTISDAVNISSRYTKAEAYNNELQLLNVNMKFEGSATADANNGFTLYQNQPNPFKDATVIGFELPTDATATLNIYDVAGRILKQIEGDFTKGYNEVSLDKSDLQATGMLYYQLVTSDFEATKKMMILE